MANNNQKTVYYNEAVKQGHINVLLSVPAYDSEWLDKVSSILAYEQIPSGTEESFELSFEFLETLDAGQVAVIADSIEHNCTVANSGEGNMIDLLRVTDGLQGRLNATQMRLIMLGYIKGATKEAIELASDPMLPYAYSNYLIQASIDGFDISEYVKERYSISKIEAICLALSSGITNIGDFITKDLAAEEISLIATALHAEEEVSITNDNIVINIPMKKTLDDDAEPVAEAVDAEVVEETK